MAAFRPARPMGHVRRGTVHSLAFLIRFHALPFVPIAETTASGFAAPLFVLIGAALCLKGRVDAVRWDATALDSLGVVVAIGPQMSGAAGFHAALMLLSALLFAVSFLITQAPTRKDAPEVIVVWQTVGVCAFSLPFAIPGMGMAEHRAMGAVRARLAARQREGFRAYHGVRARRRLGAAADPLRRPAVGSAVRVRGVRRPAGGEDAGGVRGDPRRHHMDRPPRGAGEAVG
ncbi:MAG: hypothetical protein N2Z67_09975 [Acetobacteraceae bacterium]|nr:hypothetical protein [Acetobacteraceae bacterium]